MEDNRAAKIKELRDKKAQIKAEAKQKLDNRKSQIDAQIKKIQAKVNKDKRKKETRKKILIGSAILNLVKQGKITQQEFDRMMNDFLTRDIDRKLFDL